MRHYFVVAYPCSLKGITHLADYNSITERLLVDVGIVAGMRVTNIGGGSLCKARLRNHSGCGQFFRIALISAAISSRLGFPSH